MTVARAELFDGYRLRRVGIRIEEQAGEVVLEGNQIEARTQVEDQRKARP